MLINKRVSQHQINEAIEVGNFQRLSQLKQDNLTLEVELPNIFTTAMNAMRDYADKYKPSVKCVSDQQLVSVTSARAKNKKNAIILGVSQKQKLLKKVQESNISFYALIKMLFPEAHSLPALAIDVMDTIFYNQDGSMTYVYTDSKRGLTKTKSKNYIELFLKRKSQVDFPHEALLKMQQTSSSTSKSMGSDKSRKQFLRNLDYVALLRYKDENFIRLKEHEFKSIFIRPVQANQKYKIFNNTLYLQLIPHEINYEEGTLFNIQFNLETHQKTQLFQRAVQKHSQETSSFVIQSKTTKNEIKQLSNEAYLLYIVYEIYAYVSIHYHKQITCGIFEFMKVGETFYLSNVRQVEVDESQNVKTFYASQNLFEEFVEAETQRDWEAERQDSGVLKELEKFFANQNQKICQTVKSFVATKIEDVKNKKDQEQSNSIFHSINNKYPQNLHFLLQNDLQYEKFLLRKQQQSDGYSHLTSISNIRRKRQTQKISESSLKKNDENRNAKKMIFGKSKEKINLIESLWMGDLNSKRDRPTRSKWCKRTLNGKKEYFAQKK